MAASLVENMRPVLDSAGAVSIIQGGGLQEDAHRAAQARLPCDSCPIDSAAYLSSQHDSTATDWPFARFVHGAGSRASDIGQMKKHGQPQRVEEMGQFADSSVASPKPSGAVGVQARTRTAIQHLRQSSLCERPGHGGRDVSSRRLLSRMPRAHVAGGGRAELLAGPSFTDFRLSRSTRCYRAGRRGTWDGDRDCGRRRNRPARDVP